MKIQRRKKSRTPSCHGFTARSNSSWTDTLTSSALWTVVLNLLATISNVNTANIGHHKGVVYAENERRRLAREEADRIAFEKAEKRRLKLEMKLRRRENRRLHNLEAQFTETYAVNADIEKDIINVSDFDGSDNNGMKSVGMRGGLIGELLLLTQKMKSINHFKDVSVSWPQYSTLLQNFWQSFVGEGWTIFVGVDSAFERNILSVAEGTTLDRLDTEYIRSLDADDQEPIKEYLRIHMRNQFLDSRYPGLAERRAKKMAKVKYVEPVAEDGKEENPDDEEKDENKAIEQNINDEAAGEEEQEPTETDPEYIELEQFYDQIFDLIFDERSSLVNMRFVKYSPNHLEAQVEKQDNDEDVQEKVPTPKVMALYIPVPPPQVDEEADELPTNKTDPKQQQAAGKGADGGDEGNEDGEDEAKPAEVIELKPFIPQENDFTAEFEAQVSNIDFTKKEMDVGYIHTPLLKTMISKYVQSLANLMALDDSVSLTDIINRLVLDSVKEIRDFAKSSGRDVLYINSY